jgi:Fe-S cluster assembly iron-binding protein IscA
VHESQLDHPPRPLAVSERAESHLAHLHRKAELPPGVTVAIEPGDGAHPRLVAKRPKATDRVVVTQAEGAPLLVVPAQAADALAGATLDFVLSPEPGFVVVA